MTPEEFARVQELLNSRAPEATHPRHAGSDHLLSELGKCRQCGEAYNYAPSGNRGANYKYIVCNTRKHQGPEQCDSPRLPAEVFEAMTLDVVDEDILIRPKVEIAIEELRKNAGTLDSDRIKQRDDISERIDDLDQRMTKLYIAYENGDIEHEFFAKRNRELRDLKAQAQVEFGRTEEDLDDTCIILDNPDRVLAHSDELKTFLRDETPGRAKAMAEDIPEEVLGRTRMGDLRVQPAPATGQPERRTEETQGALGRGFSLYHPLRPAHADGRWYSRVHLQTAETAELGRQAPIQAQEPKAQQETPARTTKTKKAAKPGKDQRTYQDRKEYQCASQAKRRAERIESGLRTKTRSGSGAGTPP